MLEPTASKAADSTAFDHSGEDETTSRRRARRRSGTYATEGSNPRQAGFARDHRGPTRHSAPGRSPSATHTCEPRFGQAARLRSQDFELAAISVKAGPPPSREEFERERNEARQRKMASDLEATLLTKLLVSCRPTPSRLPGHTSPPRCPTP